MRRAPVRRRLFLLLAVIAASAVPAASCIARQTVALTASLTPERLGHSATIGFGFKVKALDRVLPSPMTSIELFYPANLAFALSELGLAQCTATTLQRHGVPGCPANSVMGYGTASAAVPFGPIIVRETAHVTVLRAPTEGGHITLLIYVDGQSPVLVPLAIPAAILPAQLPFGGSLSIDVPPVPTLPEAPDAAVVRFRVAIGPQRLRYRERVHGRVIRYQPRGVPLPNRCPRGGFKFAATFQFQDGSRTGARTAVPCP
jgi:hypothetical protein